MKIIKAGRIYTVLFLITGDKKYVGNNVRVTFSVNTDNLTIDDITASVGTRDENTYIIGNLLPNTSIPVSVDLLVETEVEALNITGTVTADNIDILFLGDDSMVKNLLTETNGILASEVIDTLFSNLPEYDTYVDAASALEPGEFARFSEVNTEGVVSPNGCIIFQVQ